MPFLQGRPRPRARLRLQRYSTVQRTAFLPAVFFSSLLSLSPPWPRVASQVPHRLLIWPSQPSV